jgi:hypothetical protein
MLLLWLALGFTGGGDHHQHHDRHPSQSKVRRWSVLQPKSKHTQY